MNYNNVHNRAIFITNNFCFSDTENADILLHVGVLLDNNEEHG